MTRPPRLPMMLGLAVLTTTAHLTVALAHVAVHLANGAGAIALPVLLALAPVAAVALMLRGRPRHGAILLALTMLAAAFHTLYAHVWLADDLPAPGAQTWIVRMLLAFELQGLVAGLILSVRPEAPRARGAGEPGGG